MPAKFQHLTPMLNVADVAVSIEWYVSIGFEVLNTYEEDDVPFWACLRSGGADLMVNRRDLPKEASLGGNLYIYVDDVDALWAELKDRVTVSEPIADQFYGMRDFWIEDPDGYVVAIGQERAPGS